MNAVIALTNVCNTILSILQSAPPPTPLPPIPPPPNPPPAPTPPPPVPTQSTTRVIIHGEVDVPTKELNEENKPQDPKQQDQIVNATVADIKKKYPNLKITNVLVARGKGPVGPVW